MIGFTRKTLAVAVVLATFGIGNAFAADASLKTEKDKVSYMVGMDLGKNLVRIKDEIDTKMMVQGLEAALAGGKTAMTDEEANTVKQEFMKKLQAKQVAEEKMAAEKNKTEGDAFIAKNKAKAGVKTTASGLQYEVITEGKGPKPKATDTVKVNYLGTKVDGTKFDSSYDRNEPATFPLNGVIKGWGEALQLMPVGSKYKLVIPADLAYGEQAPPSIGPNATLVFEVELLSIENPAAAAPAPTPAPAAKK